MMLHERRVKPMRFWIAVCLCSAGCDVRETVWNDPRGPSVEQGKAVAPWNDAQLVVRPEDMDAARSDTAPTDGDASSDAAVLDAAVADAASDGPLGDAAVSDAAAPDDAFEGIDARCAFRVTTLPLGGRYAPKNIVAIWIERTDGTWVKTLAVWAGVRLRYLTAYRRANPTGNKVDAVTSATLQGFGPRAVGWNLSDAQGQEVPDGDYVVKVEITDRDATGQTFSLPFKKSGSPFVSTGADAAYFIAPELRCR